ncbi:hypothetical protein [Planococcus sp. YIM B11945]|uniref:hypothetical protein n=1 Tax=Planococcus sp. YIM B11945 TaxID=3435410 RepID=UPI003D7CA7D6
MIRILILIIAVAVVFAVAMLVLKAIPQKRKTIVLGSGAAAAVIAVFMQFSFPLYLSLLAIVAVSLLGALVYMKVLEKEELENQRLLEEKRARKQVRNPSQPEAAAELVEEKPMIKTTGMQTITVVKEEQEVG